MQTIDLKKVIQDCNLDKKELAKELFPSNDYAVMALNRIIKGESSLNERQISKLSILTGLSMNQLFSGEEWERVTNGNTHIFTCGEYKAELDINNSITKIYHNGTLFHSEVIHERTIPLNEYLNSLNSIIIKSKKS